LAMGTTVTFDGVIAGSVAAAAFHGNGALRDSTLQRPTGGNPPPSVPEPATFAFLLAGLLGLFGVIRRKKAA
jgi:hypothetical protein